MCIECQMLGNSVQYSQEKWEKKSMLRFSAEAVGCMHSVKNFQEIVVVFTFLFIYY